MAEVDHIRAADRTSRRADEVGPEEADGGRVSGSLTTWAPLLGRVLLLYVVSRLVTLAGAVVAVVVGPSQKLGTVLAQWDGTWYLAVVERGYPAAIPEVEGSLVQNTTAFFPLYPLTVRAADVVLPGGAAVAGVAVALAFGAAATVLVAVLAAALAGRAVAERSAALFCFFPGAVVFSLIYSEGVMITGAAACLLFLHHRRWIAAGLAGAVASAARPTGVVVAAACAWAAMVAIRHRREWRALVAPVLASLGMLAFFAFLWARTGEADVWFRTQREAWRDRTDFGANTARVALDVITGPFDDADQLVLGLGLVFTIAAVVCLARSGLPGPVNVYTAAVLVLPLVSAILGPRPRFVLSAFPLFIALAIKVRGRPFWAMVAGSAVLTPVLLVYYTHMFLEPIPGGVAP